MLGALSVAQVLVYTGKTDMRKSIDGLCLLASHYMQKNPAAGGVFVFFNRSRDKLKLIYWADNGFCLLYKRLEKGKFPLLASGEVVSMSPHELHLFLSGLPVKYWPKRVDKSYQYYG